MLNTRRESYTNDNIDARVLANNIFVCARMRVAGGRCLSFRNALFTGLERAKNRLVVGVAGRSTAMWAGSRWLLKVDQGRCCVDPWKRVRDDAC